MEKGNLFEGSVFGRLDGRLQKQFMEKAMYYSLNIDALVLIIGMESNEVADNVIIRLADKSERAKRNGAQFIQY